MNFEDHFVMVLSAPRRAGKSFLVEKLLRTKEIQDKYDHIIIMSPSVDFNDDYDEFRDNPKFSITTQIDTVTLDNLYEKMAEAKRKVKARERQRRRNPSVDIFEEDNELEELLMPNILLILDDAIDSGVMQFLGVLDKFAERGRHFNASMIGIAQRISAISRSVRLNADYFIIFSPFSMGEFEKFIEEFVSRDKRKELRERVDEIFSKKYEFILVDNTETDPAHKLKTSNADRFIMGDTTILMPRKDRGKKRHRDEETDESERKRSKIPRKL